jgi:hypothetical protein
MASKQASAVKTGTTEVVTAQAPVALCATQKNVAVGVWVQSDPNNAGGAVAVGDANVNAKATKGTAKGIQLLKAGQGVFLEIGDPSSLYVDVATSGDYVLWTILFA